MTHVPDELHEAFRNVARGMRGLNERLLAVEGQTMALRHMIWKTARNVELDSPEFGLRMRASLDQLEMLYNKQAAEGDSSSSQVGVTNALLALHELRQLLGSETREPSRFTVIDGGLSVP